MTETERTVDHQWLAREFREAVTAVLATPDDPGLGTFRVTHVEAGPAACIRFEGAPVHAADVGGASVPVDTAPIAQAIAWTLERRARRFANRESYGEDGGAWVAELRGEFPGWFECGLSVGPGWVDLLFAMAERVRALEPGPTFAFTQVKEKFGTLRAYSGGFTEPVSDLIDAFEVASSGICETCGGPGILRRTPGHWMRTACSEHARGAMPCVDG